MPDKSADLAHLVANGLNESAKLTLAVLGASEHPVPKTRMQKLAFLAAKVFNLEKAFDASAYHFGPFSENVVNALHEMREAGIVKPTEDGLTHFGGQVYKAVNKESAAWEEVGRLIGAVADLPDRQIVSVVYDLFPEYTNKSLIKDSATADRDYEFVVQDPAPETTLAFQDFKVRVARAG